MQFDNSKKLGILGGGQLGRMLIQAAVDFDVTIKTLDPDTDAPCKFISHEFVHGSLNDFDTVMAFAQDCDVITIEIENVNIDALEALEKIDTLVVDKTGTLTEGKPRLQKIVTVGELDENEVLKISAALEKLSNIRLQPPSSKPPKISLCQRLKIFSR